MKYGFIYIWRDKKHNRYYVGCHWGSENDGYICSSTWMLNAYNKRPQDFKRRIIKRIYTSRKDLFFEEQRFLLMIKKEEIKTRYYNLSLNNILSSKAPEICLEETKRKISDTRKSMHIKLNDDHKRKISESQKGNKHRLGVKVSEETKRKISSTLKGRQKTNEHKEKLSNSLLNKTAWNKGRPHSEEHKKKISETLKRRNFENKYQK